MATHFDGDISVENQIQTADVIINGRIVDVISGSEQDKDDEMGYTTYQVEVQDVIAGELKDMNLKLRIAKTESKSDDMVNLKKNQSYLMLLGQDYGPRNQNQYVPYYGSCFMVDENNRVKLPSSIQNQLVELDMAGKKAPNIQELAASIKEVIRKKSELEEKLKESQPEELKHRGMDEETFEIPGGDFNHLVREGKIGPAQE